MSFSCCHTARWRCGGSCTCRSHPAHYSSGNVIERNRFADISGDPMRIWDASGHNRVLENQCYRTGMTVFHSEWFCEAERSDCTKPTPERPSIGNEFRSNQLYNGYDVEIATFKLFGPDDACGPLPEPRLRTSGNVQY